MNDTRPSEDAQIPPQRLAAPPEALQVTPAQGKLLESALRIKILHTLAEEPLTSKQVAEKLGKTPGNVHYHMMKLLGGGLLELVRTDVSGGVVQKFYRSVATLFRLESFTGFQFAAEHKVEHFKTRLTLSPEELEDFRRDMLKLITFWESKATSGGEYGVEMIIGQLPQADSDSDREVNS
ncbi:winged helix-turn-helix domain-containing protein [Paenibacillus tengchongensis]|uniref:winged helix-turn-helix domain-containing protein n=1 Tax=Paenibacillus tengchongensis TaxID=2608684 RepID=UPI00124E1448|nr:winged helix-turn-helix domain-containing protein [Paenibacillus tengchongensis]